MLSLRRRLMKWLVAGSAATAMLVLLLGVAAAHTTTVAKSDPVDGATVTGSPAQVTVQFTEELDTKKSVMQVFDASNQQVSQGNGRVDLNDPNHQTMFATLPTALPAGAYTVKWHVYLTDGDDSSGQFGFAVAASAGREAIPSPSATAVPSPSPAATATTIAHQAATATAVTTPAAAAAGQATATAQAASTTAAQSQAPRSLPATGGNTPAVAWPAPVALALAVVACAVFLGVRSRAR